jgi:glutaminase
MMSWTSLAMAISRRGLAMAILVTCATVVAAVPRGPSNDPRESVIELSNMTSSPQTSPVINSPRTGEQKKRSIRKYLEEHGIGMQDIPKALLVYESMSMTLLYALSSSFSCCIPILR